MGCTLPFAKSTRTTSQCPALHRVATAHLPSRDGSGSRSDAPCVTRCTPPPLGVQRYRSGEVEPSRRTELRQTMMRPSTRKRGPKYELPPTERSAEITFFGG